MYSRRFFFPLLIAFGVMVALYAGYRYISPAMEVETTKVVVMRPADTQVMFSANGYVVPQRKASLSAKITGRLAWLGVREGSRVTKGQRVATLDDQEYRGAVELAKAQVDVSRHQLAQSQAALTESRQNLDRARTLYEKGFYSGSLLDSAEARVLVDSATTAASQAQLQAAKTALNNSGVALDQTRIQAPFDGVITILNANVGDVITPFSASLEAKGAVLTIVDPASLEIETEITESQFAHIHDGLACLVRLDAFPDTPVTGTVSRVVPNVDRARGSVKVMVSFDHASLADVFSNMSARVDFLPRHPEAEELVAVTVVDRDALTGTPDHSAVYLMEVGRVHYTPVTTGRSIGRHVEIRSGLNPGQTVVLRPASSLMNGAAVTEKR